MNCVVMCGSQLEQRLRERLPNDGRKIQEKIISREIVRDGVCQIRTLPYTMIVSR